MSRTLRIHRLAAIAALSAALAGPAGAATIPHLVHPASAPAQGKILNFHGFHVRIGSAAAKALAMSRSQPNMLLLPAHRLYVADPSLNAVVIYNAQDAGPNRRPWAVLSGAQTQLNGPVALTEGYDLPCNPPNKYDTTHCPHYLWVANAGNNSVTTYKLPLTAGNQAPWAVNTTPDCAFKITSPYGITHLSPSAADPNNIHMGLYVTADEGTNAVLYSSAAFAGNITNCPWVSDNDPRFVAPSGPSSFGKLPKLNVFNANSQTVTETIFNDPAVAPGGTWTLASPNAYTQGTAFEKSLNEVLASATGSNVIPDGIWICNYADFSSVNGCPAVGPAITAGIDYPVFMDIWQNKDRLFVPNGHNGTVTSYDLPGVQIRATYINLVNPFGVAVGN